MLTKTPTDYPSQQIVSVIASFDTDGHIKPIYVRIGSESYKIQSCWLKPSFYGQQTFYCKVIDNNTLKPLELTYHIMESAWTMPKIPML